MPYPDRILLYAPPLQWSRSENTAETTNPVYGIQWGWLLQWSRGLRIS